MPKAKPLDAMLLRAHRLSCRTCRAGAGPCSKAREVADLALRTEAAQHAGKCDLCRLGVPCPEVGRLRRAETALGTPP